MCTCECVHVCALAPVSACACVPSHLSARARVPMCVCALTGTGQRRGTFRRTSALPSLHEVGHCVSWSSCSKAKGSTGNSGRAPASWRESLPFRGCSTRGCWSPVSPAWGAERGLAARRPAGPQQVRGGGVSLPRGQLHPEPPTRAHKGGGGSHPLCARPAVWTPRRRTSRLKSAAGFRCVNNLREARRGRGRAEGGPGLRPGLEHR